MADTETKVETKVSGTPEKKVVEEKKEKEVVEKKVEEAEEESKPVDNGNLAHEKENNGNTKNGVAKENGSIEEKEVDEEEEEEKDEEATENGDSTDAPVSNDACSIKRKSTGGDVSEDAVAEVTSPKKAKLDDKVAEVEINGKAAEVKA